MVASRLLYLLLAICLVPLFLSWWFSTLAGWAVGCEVLILFIALADLWLSRSSPALNASRTVDGRLSLGRMNPVEVSVTNQGARAIQCRLRDDFPRQMDSDVVEFNFKVRAGSTAHLRYNLGPKVRGVYHFGNINIRYLSFLRLFWLSVTVKASSPLAVFCDLQSLKQLSIRLGHQSELGRLKDRHQRQGTDFSSLREYQVGDDHRHIDWKATARRDQPVVRVFDAEQEQVLLVLCDAGRMMVSELSGLTKFDHALNAALSLCLTGISRNDKVGFGVFADKPLLYLPAARGKGHFKAILESSLNLGPKMIEPDYIGALSHFAALQKGRCLMVLLTDLTDAGGSHLLLSGLRHLRGWHLPLCVTLRDREIDRIASARAFDLDEIYRKAVAQTLLGQRELALQGLLRDGCLVIDSYPEELSDRLVEGYLDVKIKGKL